MVQNSLEGVLPILQTPFTEQGSIDWGVLEEEIDWVFSIGAHGIGSGMVSEVRSFTAEERERFAKCMVSSARGRGPAFMAVTANNRQASLKHARNAAEAGCQAIMSAPPLEESLGEDELFEFFSQLYQDCRIPVIVQDASGYMGRSIPHSVYLRLLDRHGNEAIVFKPEAPPNGPNISRLRDATQGQAQIFEGSGGIYLIDSMRRGVAGTMPGTDLLDGIVAVWEHMRHERYDLAYSVHLPLSAIVSLQMQAGLDGFLEIEKYLLQKRGLFKNRLRRPPVNWQLDDETLHEIDRLFERLQSNLIPLAND